MPTSLIVPAVTGAISFGANKLFAGKGSSGSTTAVAGTEPLTSFRPLGFTGGGLTSSFSPDGVGITADAARNAAVSGLASTFGQQADQIGGLRATVAPGFSDARRAALGQIESARQSSIGNLRENLQRRRVLGSSFAQDAASRTEAEFAQQKAVTEAQSYLQELEATNQLMQQEFAARRGVFQTGLDEMNLEANLAAGLAGKASDVLSKNAQVEAMLNSQTSQFNAKQNATAEAGMGKFIGGLTQPFADAAGKGAGKFFAGLGGPTALGLMPTSI